MPQSVSPRGAAVPGVLGDGRDASREDPDVVRDASRLCTWCAGPIGAAARRDALYCGVVCRKRAWRFGQAIPRRSPSVPRLAEPRDASRPAGGSPGRFAYADPPYPGLAGYYVERQEVDHASLLEQLVAGRWDGWALSTSAAALPAVLRICPVRIRVAVWRRQVRPTRSRRPLSAWEPLIVWGGRELPSDRPQEVIDHLDYRGRYDSYPGALVGMKPPEFAVWMFALLGAQPGDELADLFPGSGAIRRAWDLYTSPGPEGRVPRVADLRRAARR
ncbi:MAG: hypothetical protein M3Y09_14040 [Actinomycetota bacterium]|nr:hypothetical protein [Actinomycetota bacterium]